MLLLMNTGNVRIKCVNTSAPSRSSNRNTEPHVLHCRDAVRKMLDANVSGAPVINSSGQLVGVLTEADVIWKVCAPAPKSNNLQ